MEPFKISNIKYSYETNIWEEFELKDEIKTMTEIEIPKETIEISNYACYECENVKNIHIPHTVSKIGIGAFAKCYNLKEINIPDGVEILENDTFYDCHELETITISPNLKKVSETALLNCQKLKTIYIACDNYNLFEEYLKKIKNSDLLNNISIKWKYVNTSKSIFSFSSEFDFTTIPNYDKCSYLVIPSSITKLKSCKGAKSLEFIEFYDLNKIKLGEYVFENCNKIKEIELNDIPKGAFKNCKGLKHVIIKGNVGELAFEDCKDLEIIDFVKLKDEIDKNEKENEKDKNEEDEEKQNEISISKSAFKNCHSIKSINLSNINSLSESAFENCYKLNSVILSNISFIPKSCFKSCFEIEKIIFPDSVRKIEESAFENCYKLKYIDLRFVKIIEKYALENVSSLKN